MPARKDAIDPSSPRAYNLRGPTGLEALAGSAWGAKPGPWSRGMGRIYEVMRRAHNGRQAPAERIEPIADISVLATGDADGRRLGPVRLGDEEDRGRSIGAPSGVTTGTPRRVVDPARVPAALFVVADPSGSATERLGAIRTRVLRMMRAAGHRVLAVTSPGGAEGKSTTAANLALLLGAEIGVRVLLVDGDLRRSRLGDLFGVPREPGLADVMRGALDWREAAITTPWNGLALLPAGGRVRNVSELLNGPSARSVIEELRSAYDIVLVDTPPLLANADAGVLAELSDAVLLVARSGRTPREALDDAVEMLNQRNVLGLVLNALPDVPFGRRTYYGYHEQY